MHQIHWLTSVSESFHVLCAVFYLPMNIEKTAKFQGIVGIALAGVL